MSFLQEREKKEERKASRRPRSEHEQQYGSEGGPKFAHDAHADKIALFIHDPNPLLLVMSLHPCADVHGHPETRILWPRKVHSAGVRRGVPSLSQ